MARTDKSEKIIETAVKLFTSRRYHEVTLDEVAKAARIGKGTIYLYFKDKDDLFFRAATHGFDELCETLRNGTLENAPFEEKLQSMLERIHHYFESRKPMMRVLFEHGDRAHSFRGKMRATWEERRTRLNDLISPVFAEGIARGHIRSDVPPDTLAGLLFGFIGGTAHSFHGKEDSRPSINQLLDIFLNGVSVRAQEDKG